MQVAADPNRDTYAAYVREYQSYQLWPPERAIVERFKDRWHKMRVLDLGVGTGRSAYTFGAIAREYVGTDYVPEMVEECKRTCGDMEGARFEVVDARDLSRYADGSFEFVLFCWNGIDSVAHEDRRLILDEVRRVLVPGGHFFFSTHTVYDFPFRRVMPRFKAEAPVRSLYRMLRALPVTLRAKREYRGLDPETVWKQDYVMLRPPDHGFGLMAHYVRPDFQLRQLAEVGFETLAVYDQRGRVVDACEARHSGYLYLLCRAQAE